MAATPREPGTPEDKGADRDPARDPGECDATREAIAAFLGQIQKGGQPIEFREHLLACAECRTLYREAVASTARLGQHMRTERIEGARRRVHEGMRERARAATGDRRRRNRFGLRLALLPAGIALLILLTNGRRAAEQLEVHWDGGEVVTAGQLMDGDRPVLVLRAGDWCETRGKARARVLGAEEGPAFELAGRTAIQLEDAEAFRIRLARGELELLGPGSVLTPHGVLEVEEGRARLSLSGTTYDLACLEGTAAWVGPTGRRTLSAGASIESGSVLAGSP